MADNTPTEETEDQSLRSALEAAFDEAPPSEEAPAETPELDDEGQPRDDKGRWTKAQQEHYEREQKAQQEQQEAQAQEQPQEQELRLAPPPGWSPAAKAAYAKLPPEVQEAVARREQEVNNGFARLRDYKGLEEAAEMARASGTTLKEAFDRYRAAEDALDRDFGGGVVELCQMYGVHPMQLAHHIAAQYGGQAGPARGQGTMQQLDPQTNLIAQRLAGIEEVVSTLKSEHERQEQEAINGYVSDFGSQHMYYEDVRHEMAHLIRAGLANSLEEAYDKACWANPQIRDLLIKEQAAPQDAAARVSQARRASGSLRTGAPAGTPSGSSTNSIRAALENAWGEASV